MSQPVHAPSPQRLVAAVLAIGSMLGAAPSADAASEAPRELAVCADPSNLPFSNDREEGFENRIASLLARDLNATVRYTWNMQRRSFLRRTLKAGACDVVVGVPAGLPAVAVTRPYYASSYVFVTAPARHPTPRGFDDPALRDLKIGLQAIGADGSNTPPAGSLSRRGLVDHVVGFPMWAEEGDETPQGRIVDAVASGEIDLAIVWGPFAGYFAKRHGQALQIEPVTADSAAPGLVFPLRDVARRARWRRGAARRAAAGARPPPAGDRFDPSTVRCSAGCAERAPR